MTGAEATAIWQRALEPIADFRVQAAQGLPQGYDRFSAAVDVLAALKSALIAAVTTDEQGALGVITRELTLLQKESFVVVDQPPASPYAGTTAATATKDRLAPPAEDTRVE